MKSKMTTLVLACALAMTVGAAFAQSYPVERKDPYEAGFVYAQYVYGPGVYDPGVYGPPPNDLRPDWYRRWQLRRLYGQPQGYVPDNHLCFPGACQDNPYY
jgi:hypothetical protein